MSHDIEAAWATTEIAALFKRDPTTYISSNVDMSRISICASTDKRKIWPIADGIVSVDDYSNNSQYSIAVEYKRLNEGLHGVLTALGQAHAYIHKGFSASAIVIPERYDSHNSPAEHLNAIIEKTSKTNPIFVFKYTEPDVSNESPFYDRLLPVRGMKIKEIQVEASEQIVQRVETQWGHMREGSSDSHAFYLYLKTAKLLPDEATENYTSDLPINVVHLLSSRDIQNIDNYLSNSVGESFHDKVWRKFWFSYVCIPDMLCPWKKNDGVYYVNEAKSKIKIASGEYKSFFSGRSDSIKNKLVESLNKNEINENDAFLQFYSNVRNRAHSYREDIDSGLEALNLIDSEGRPTDYGYKFIDATERGGNPDGGLSAIILSNLLLNNANYGAFLHYIYRASEKHFSQSPMSFTIMQNGSYRFDINAYLEWLSDKLVNELAVMRKVSARGGQSRKPFQAELAILRRYNLVHNFRIGVGLEINWPEVQKLINYEI